MGLGTARECKSANRLSLLGLSVDWLGLAGIARLGWPSLAGCTWLGLAGNSRGLDVSGPQVHNLFRIWLWAGGAGPKSPYAYLKGEAHIHTRTIAPGHPWVSLGSSLLVDKRIWYLLLGAFPARIILGFEKKG